ncbi:hypothetical protein Xcel_2183 [Xylanimonas cellulosilytica DSM 15894]|uniref:Uncharacterized protein n=1 Tax=Xylanimonas cellulosilytica (strain DSM 15894 / JCM 12276 / CECT 5975 / KCTC 9989 / LMG 20990 / NBRC 107835 / XIL07) TaxID=446471 RepID=D1BUW2_XYLCX|nr:hypothetical protein [Xylanimonas cellulosilytica]ACZ31201.1 hypothetical protein Xcel_2183 [Xylanimonas cellulosilytica DSM 15894]
MTDAAETTARSPREPFAGVPVRDLVREVVSVTAMLVGLALPWTATERGSDRLEVVLATVVAVLAVALPYARRAQLVSGGWAADEQRTRWIGVAPVAVVALIHVVLDVVPGGSLGVGAGLGLTLAGALLVAGAPWPRAVVSVAGAIGLGAVAVPLLAVTDGGLGAWTVVGLVLTALLVLGVLWLTAGRFERGDAAAGVLLVGVGIVVALGAALVGGAAGGWWVESVHGTQFGLVLLPVLAATAVPRVVGQAVAADAQPRLWAAVAVHALELGLLVGAYVALAAVVGLISSGGSVVENTLRLIFGVLAAVALFFARRALVRDLASGHTTAVGAAVVVSVLGLVLIVVRAGGSTAVHPVDLLLAFGAPAVVLSALLVPRSLRELRSHGPVPLVEGEPDDAGAYDGAAYDGGAYDDGGAAHGAQPYGAQPYGAEAYGAAAYGAAAGPQAAAAAAEVQAEVVATIAPQVSAAETTVMRPITDAPGTAEQATAEQAAQPAQPAQPAPTAQPAAPAVGPFGNVGATQVLPPVVDVPGSRWTAAHALDPGTPLADLALIVQESPHLRPLVAANPSTYPALLDWLGALGDPDVDAALRTRG